MDSLDSSRKDKFGWTLEETPKGNMPQCGQCTNVEVGSPGKFPCRVFTERPWEYISNEEACPFFIKK